MVDESLELVETLGVVGGLVALAHVAVDGILLGILALAEGRLVVLEECLQVPDAILPHVS